MKRRPRVARYTIPLLLALTMMGGCATAPQAVRPDAPGIRVHVPAVESPRVRLQTDTPWLPPAEVPSLTDEYKGRWLTLFEMTFTPAEKERPPGTDEGP